MDELNRAYEALQKAHDAGDVEGAKQIAEYARSLEAGSKADNYEAGADQGLGIPESAVGAAMGASLGAAAGPAVGSAVDTAANIGAKMINPAAAGAANMPGSNSPSAVRKWLATQSSNPFAGGRTQEEAYKKSEIAAGKPVQSRGSKVPIRKGNLGISNQIPEATMPQKAAANIINAEKVGKPGVARRVAGMGVAGAELGNMIEEAKQGHYGHAALSGLGALGGAATQSRIKPIRAIGTGLSVAVPAIQKLVLPDEDEEVQKKAAGGKILKKAIGFLEHTPSKPDPLVGTRYKSTDLGGLLPQTPFDIESALRAKMLHRPYDLSGRNQLIEEVSGHKLINPVTTEGGQQFGRDIALQATGQGGASNKSINDRILKRVEAAAREGDGRVFNNPSTMGYGSEAFSTMPIDILLDLIKQRQLPKETLDYLSNLVRAKSPALQNFVGFNDPRVTEQFLQGGHGLTTTPGKLRVGATDVLTGKQNKAQSLLDYNQEDLFNAIRDPDLRNVPPGYMGNTIMEAVPGHPGFTTGSHRAYDSGDASIYRGQGINAPISVWMPDSYKQAFAEVRANPKSADKSLGHQRAMARNILGTAEEGVAQTITPQVADNVQRFQEAVKAGKLDANDLEAIHKYIYGAKAHEYAKGGKVGILEAAAAAFKKQFTPGFYHGSPRNNIKEFDTQAERNPNFLTALEEESNDLAPRGFISLTNTPKFSNDYATGKNATVYPVSANLGKHFDPRLPENYDVFHKYWKGNPESFPNYYGSPASLPKSFREAEWSVMEDPGFLEYLKSKGYNSMTMVENGQPNVGIFDPKHIRGKFAKYNPEDAESADFMKAAGGAIEGYAPGGKVVRSGLTELMELIKNQGGAGAAQRLERAADLVPNLEHQYQPQALKEAFTGNRSVVSVMNPADFEKYAAPISSETKSSLSKSRRIGEPGPGQDYTHMPLGTYDDYIKYLQQFSEPGGGGFRSMPYLQLGQRKGFSFPNIQGHEGRHRTDALTRQGNQSTLVGIEPRPELRELPRRSQEEYLNALAKEVGGKSPFVMPQESEVKRGLIELPEMFKKGGKV